ncbi:MAG: hypothetical protein ACJARD_001138 [Alphaproteobacteria bacterium]|jgi:membrane protein implicated in regulation of membrane protease activity
MSDIVIWSILGMVLMMLEIFGIQGIGVLFTGFSAITVSLLIYINPDLNSNIGLQLLYFFIFTAIWSAILWVPLKKFINYGDSGDYSNIIGTYANVSKDMEKGKVGEIIWSGTKVRAMIADENTKDQISAETSVKITSVIDGMFYVTENLRKENTETDNKGKPKKKVS